MISSSANVLWSVIRKNLTDINFNLTFEDLGLPIPNSANLIIENQSNTDINSVVSFSCPPGYNLIGSANITCTGDSYLNMIWSGPLPNCIESFCPTLTSSKLLLPNTSLTNLNTTVSFKCSFGLDLIGPQTITCIWSGSAATWSAEPPICSGIRFNLLSDCFLFQN